jgi:hypothetical protein
LARRSACGYGGRVLRLVALLLPLSLDTSASGIAPMRQTFTRAMRREGKSARRVGDAGCGVDTPAASLRRVEEAREPVQAYAGRSACRAYAGSS